MKRHQSLVPLSHDHHHGLVLAQRLKRGESKAPRSGWPKDRPSQRDRTVEFYHSQLAGHFQREEAHVFPLAERYLPQGADLVAILVDEHRKLEQLVGIMQQTQEGLNQILVDFGRLLEKHIRREENELFEQLQERVPENILLRAGQVLRD